MTKCVIYWRAGVDPAAIASLREKFGIPQYTTVNGESPCEVDYEQMQLLRECERRGFLTIRDKKWRKNGDQFIW